MKTIKIIAPALTILLSACTIYPNSHRRIIFTESITPEDCKIEHIGDIKHICSNSNEYHSGNTHIYVIELDDQGHYVDYKQKDRLISHLSQLKSPFILNYIHGWNHNAAKQDNDFLKFNQAVKFIQNEQKNRPVVGVYIAWRGRTLPHKLNLFTFWGRKSVSEEVGRNGLSDLILQIEKISKSVNGFYSIIGHSFGASATYNTISPILLLY